MRIGGGDSLCELNEPLGSDEFFPVGGQRAHFEERFGQAAQNLGIGRSNRQRHTEFFGGLGKKFHGVLSQNFFGVDHRREKLIGRCRRCAAGNFSHFFPALLNSKITVGKGGQQRQGGGGNCECKALYMSIVC